MPPIFLAGTTRLELANQLIEGQPAFPFRIHPQKDLKFQISNLKRTVRMSLKFEIRDVRSLSLVPAEGFEPTLSSF